MSPSPEDVQEAVAFSSTGENARDEYPAGDIDIKGDDKDVTTNDDPTNSCEEAAPPHIEADADADEPRSRPRSRLGERKNSLRTEALIQAAARAVIAKMEKHKASNGTGEGTGDIDAALLDAATAEVLDAYPLVGDETIRGPSRSSSRQSTSLPIRHIPSRSASSVDTADSAQHDRDDDVFSNHSAHSSVYSLDGHGVDDIPGAADEDPLSKTPQASERHGVSRRDSYASSTGTTPMHGHHSDSRVMSGFSSVSGLSQYEQDNFVPASREKRVPFRTPSEIQAMQMSSPTPSVFGGSSPRSAKRRSMGTSVQYSPKGRSTPTRFKGAAAARREAPLVLLHVTLLPLRWVWGDVLNAMDAIIQAQASAKASGLELDETGHFFEPSDQLKGLRDSWRELQDRVGDTVLERGILIPHPQNDYEVLEERLLEALELPVKKRARILECGHYLGPSNIMSYDIDDDDRFYEDEEEREERQRHWCSTCRDEIRFEKLGPGKVFRIKVYASNGLMKAGAWEACWKEMERVDVELEPIVDSSVQNELERLAALQLELEEQRRQAIELERLPELEADRKPELLPDHESRASSRLRSEPPSEMSHLERMSSPTPSGMQLSLHSSSQQRSSSLARSARSDTPARCPIDTSEERRRRDEERMREIYGETPPPPAPEPAPAQTQARPQTPAVVDQQPPAQQQQTQLYQPQQFPSSSPAAMQVGMPMLTDGSSLHHRHPHHHTDSYTTPHTNSYPSQPAHTSNTNNDQKRRVVLDENSGFVELLMEAFKVLLRDPKNVAIIVLCVFLVVLMKSPAMRNEAQNQLVHVPPPTPPEPYVPPKQAAPAAPAAAEVEVAGVQQQPGQGQVEQIVVPSVVGQQQQQEVSPEAGEVVVAQRGVEPVGIHQPVEEVPGVAEVEAAPKLPEIAAAEEVPPVEVTQNVPEIEAQVAAVEEPAPVQIDLGPVCLPRGLEYPMTMADEAPVNDLTVEKHVSDDCADNVADPDLDEPTGRCSIDISSDSDAEEAEPAPSSSASTSSVFIPGPFVTERKTVRVYETVTETVQVSVVTKTETVSTVVTAVPQTVEETVFETETVRITVSVPVEEQKTKKVKAGSEKACKEKGGKWF
ncbi:hypothetical protein VTJ04DRAFT_9329 [Mycothermus thermophilus]|uniref:uncharacterized protein n=1 Tax=Humicola insolens TaxID=85995 RepID=UPI0037447D8E